MRVKHPVVRGRTETKIVVLSPQTATIWCKSTRNAVHHRRVTAESVWVRDALSPDHHRHHHAERRSHAGKGKGRTPAQQRRFHAAFSAAHANVTGDCWTISDHRVRNNLQYKRPRVTPMYGVNQRGTWCIIPRYPTNIRSNVWHIGPQSK